ncbi:terpene synthase family protein [Kitasatospora sp. LaBMicrA B282]|uniref:terpene synthase family protein n=1 Tax=Kitasatospora sp. LaBMicrA B282 TaxID=3420949 RepID=UPI003D0C7BEF
MDWTVRMGLMSPPVAERFFHQVLYADAACWCYPMVPGDALSAVVDFYVWFFVYDDQQAGFLLERDSAGWQVLCTALHAAIEVPREFTAHRDPVVRGLADVLVRLRRESSPRFIRRFASNMHSIVDGYLTEYDGIANDALPVSLDDYLTRVRRSTFGGPVWVDLLELGCELPQEVFESGPFQRAAWATMDFAILFNDVYSVEKEIAAGAPSNACAVIMRTTGCDLQEAIDRTAGLVRACVDGYRSAEAELRQRTADADPTVRAAVGHAVANMRGWFPAMCAYHEQTSRYAMQEWADPARPSYLEQLAPGGREPVERHDPAPAETRPEPGAAQRGC